MVKIALRNIRKNKGFSIINMAGLAMGITCFLLLAAYVYHELSYDKYLSNYPRLAYVSMGYKSGQDGDFTYMGVTPTAVAPSFKKEFPEVEAAVRMYTYNGAALVKKGSELLKESKLKYVDEDFLEVLNFEVLLGNNKDPLKDPNTIVLTERLAKKYFTNSDAVGKTIVIDKDPWLVTAVIADVPSYSELKFDALMSNKGLERYKEPNWGSANDVTFLLLNSEQSFATMQKKVDGFIQEQFKDAIAQGFSFVINLEPISKVHLYSKTAGTGNIVYLYIFAFLGIALLIISCLNFTNLSLAHAAERGKEIGVKKVLGAYQSVIFKQFLTEGGLMVFISLFFGIVFAWLLLPFFSAYLGIPMSLNIWDKPLFYILVLGFFIVLSLMANGWPAWLISKFKPVDILKGDWKSKKSKFPLAKILITFQYTVSIFLVICTLLAYQQMHFIQTMNTGLNRSQVVVLDGDIWNNTDRETLKNKLLANPSIKSVSASYDSPVNIQGGYSINYVEGKTSDFNLNITAIPIEKDFLKVFEIPIVAGSDLTDVDIVKARDTSVNRSVGFILNKLAASNLGWTPEQAIGKQIHMNGRKGPVKAVVDNFNFASLHTEVQPIVLFPEYQYFGNIFIKIKEGVPTSKALDDISRIFKEIKPNSPFEKHFLDEDYAAMYTKEQQSSKIMQLFAIVTILIACIGLFALSAYSAKQRIKEIGIRKVLGASVVKLVGMLSKDYILLVMIAFLIALPLGYWAMDKWLDNFAYHSEMEWWIFLLAGGITLVVSLITISSQTIKAAKANPIHSLKDE